MAKRTKFVIEGRKITEESALRLFEKIVGRTASDAEKRQLNDAWRKAKLPHARPGQKVNGHS